jgi:hypothetical protein
MTVIAIFFLKSWTLYLSYSLATVQGPINVVIVFFFYFGLVIFGSFCLLNLTVATVSEIYSKLKKASELKRKLKNEEQAKKDALEEERRARMANAKAAKKEDEDEDDEPKVTLRFDTRFECSFLSTREFPYCAIRVTLGKAYKLWLFVMFPVLHRFYMKCWYEGHYLFYVRVATFNFFFLGWIWDGLTMQSLNTEASTEQQARDDRYREQVEAEFCRIDAMVCRMQAEDEDDPPQLSEKLALVLAYPDPHFTRNPLYQTREYLRQEKARLSDGDSGADDAGDAGSADGLSDVDDDDDEPLEERPVVKVKEDEGQSYFAWFADFVVVANAASMAMQGFGDQLSIIITTVGYFATVFFVLESAVKSVAYGGFSYYLVDGSNRFDFGLVVIPTFGELVCQLTKALFGREDYIYLMLALRALRVLRILKLVKHLKGLKKLAMAAFKSPGGVIYAFLVTMIFIFIYALFGNEIFKKSPMYAANRNDYANIVEAVIAQIESLFGDKYYDNIEIGNIENGFVGMFYHIIFMYICNFLVLRIFIAIILENFEFSEERKVALQIQLYQRKQILMNDLINGRSLPCPGPAAPARVRPCTRTQHSHGRHPPPCCFTNTPMPQSREARLRRFGGARPLRIQKN